MTFLRLFGLFSLAAIAGCGERGGGGDGSGIRPPGGGDPIPQEQFCDEALPAVCEANLRCCMDPTMRYTTVDSCVAAQRAQCEAVFDGAAFRDGRIRWNAEAAGSLLARFESASATCTDAMFGEGELGDVIIGTVGEGGDCTPTMSDFSPVLACMPGLRCSLGETSGVCSRPAGAGDSCADASCDEGLFCNDASVCERERANGEACSFGSECLADSFCNDMGVCEPSRADGAACTFSSQCRSFDCTDGVCAPDPGSSSGGDYCLDMD